MAKRSGYRTTGNSNFTSEVKGIEDTLGNFAALLNQLDPKEQGLKILEPALQRSARLLKNEVVTNLTQTLDPGLYSTGNLARNVTITKPKKQLRTKGRCNILIGIKKKGSVIGGKVSADSTHYAHFVEFGAGVSYDYPISTGRAKGTDAKHHQRPQAFFRRALESTKAGTMILMEQELATQFNKVAKKISDTVKKPK